MIAAGVKVMGDPKVVVVPLNVSVKVIVPLGGMPRTEVPVEKSAPNSTVWSSMQQKKSDPNCGVPLVTVAASAGDVVVVLLLSPEYTAVRLCVPIFRQNCTDAGLQLVKTAWPLLSN